MWYALTTAILITTISIMEPSDYNLLLVLKSITSSRSAQAYAKRNCARGLQQHYRAQGYQIKCMLQSKSNQYIQQNMFTRAPCNLNYEDPSRNRAYSTHAHHQLEDGYYTQSHYETQKSKTVLCKNIRNWKNRKLAALDYRHHRLCAVGKKYIELKKSRRAHTSEVPIGMLGSKKIILTIPRLHKE